MKHMEERILAAAAEPVPLLFLLPFLLFLPVLFS